MQGSQSIICETCFNTKKDIVYNPKWSLSFLIHNGFGIEGHWAMFIPSYHMKQSVIEVRIKGQAYSSKVKSSRTKRKNFMKTEKSKKL